MQTYNICNGRKSTKWSRFCFDKSIIDTNVLVIDDVATSGTTISHILNSLRSVNDNNNIVIFSLIGKKMH